VNVTVQIGPKHRGRSAVEVDGRQRLARHIVRIIDRRDVQRLTVAVNATVGIAIREISVIDAAFTICVAAADWLSCNREAADGGPFVVVVVVLFLVLIILLVVFLINLLVLIRLLDIVFIIVVAATADGSRAH